MFYTKKMKKDKVKSCPCCKSNNIDAIQYVIEACVCCRNCGLSMTVEQSVKNNQLEKAIKKWNRREV